MIQCPMMKTSISTSKNGSMTSRPISKGALTKTPLNVPNFNDRIVLSRYKVVFLFKLRRIQSDPKTFLYLICD